MLMELLSLLTQLITELVLEQTPQIKNYMFPEIQMLLAHYMWIRYKQALEQLDKEAGISEGAVKDSD